MMRLPLRFGVLGALLAALLAAGSALAQSRVGFLIEQLQNATDFRLRTQAALALGSSEDRSAVEPLCSALDDTNDSVRSAAAAALGKLNNSAGLPCLTDHLTEPNASVRSVIERSAKGLQSSTWPSKPPPPGPSDTFYVAIGPVTDKTGRDDKTVAELVGSTMQERLLALHGYAVAPQGEAAAAARRIVKQKSLRGYLLQTRVETPRASSGGLTIQIHVTMWTYPAKALQGEFSPKLTMSGASVGEKESEDNLIKMAVEKAIESFAQVTASTN